MTIPRKIRKEDICTLTTTHCLLSVVLKRWCKKKNSRTESTTRRASLQDCQTHSNIPRVRRCWKPYQKRKIQIAWTTNMAIVGPHQAETRRKPDAATCHARESNAHVTRIYVYCTLCWGKKEASPNLVKLASCVRKGFSEQIAAFRRECRHTE